MLRSPVTLAALGLSLAGITGQVLLHLHPDGGTGFGLVWVAVGNAAIGILVGVSVLVYLLSDPVKTASKDPSWRSMIAPAGLAYAAQVAAAVVLGVAFSAQGHNTLFVGSVLAVLVAGGTILAGLLMVMMLIVPVVVIGFYVMSVVQYRRLRKAMGDNGSAAEAPFGIGALFSSMLLLIVGFAAFCVTAYTASRSDSGAGRLVRQTWAVFFDFTATGPVDQPLAWGARVCAIGLVAVSGLLIAAGFRLASARRKSQET
jgi:hypothetical protein